MRRASRVTIVGVRMVLAMGISYAECASAPSALFGELGVAPPDPLIGREPVAQAFLRRRVAGDGWKRLCDFCRFGAGLRGLFLLGLTSLPRGVQQLDQARVCHLAEFIRCEALSLGKLAELSREIG